MVRQPRPSYWQVAGGHTGQASPVTPGHPWRVDLCVRGARPL